VGAASLVAATHWAVRSRWIRPTSWWPRTVRSLSEPVLRPFERRVVRWGGNPQDAPFWLAVAALIAGLLLVLGVRSALGAVTMLGQMRGAGLTQWLSLAVSFITWLLMTAILIRVVGSWLGAGRYNKGMRPFYFLTDWLIEPLRRRLPPMGAMDLSPVAAYFLILIIRAVLLGALR
jgi:YggT family protein